MYDSYVFLFFLFHCICVVSRNENVSEIFPSTACLEFRPSNGLGDVSRLFDYFCLMTSCPLTSFFYSSFLSHFFILLFICGISASRLRKSCGVERLRTMEGIGSMDCME